MKRIKLTHGKFALVDNADFGWLNQWKWCTYAGHGTLYASRAIKVDSKWVTISIHRQIMGLKKGDDLQVDHRNGNGLDNKRQNLRICSKRQNDWNRRPKKGSAKALV